jgi:hypothetical protein
MTTAGDLAVALYKAAKILDWEREVIQDFHDYAQHFGASPGSNVFKFALKDALKFRDVNIEAVRRERPWERENRAMSFDEMMNRIAPILDGTPNAHARAEKIITALFGEWEASRGVTKDGEGAKS